MSTADETDGFDDFFKNARPAPEYQGLSAEQAQDLAQRQGVAVVRVIEPLAGTPVGIALDLQPDRLNLVVLDGLVNRAAFC